MKCSKCGGEQFENREQRFSPKVRDQTLEIIMPCFVCLNCSTPLMNAEQMNTLRRVAVDNYRIAHNLLTSQQIIAFRENLGMSQTAFARYLKVGEASIKRWETYYVQDASQDEHMRMKCDLSHAQANYLDLYWKNRPPDIFSGYVDFKLPLFKNVLLYLIQEAKEPLSLWLLNKFQFLVDFWHFKNFSRGITGARYIPMHLAPCPEELKFILNNLISDGELHCYQNYYEALVNPNLTLFDAQEKLTLLHVCTHMLKWHEKNIYEQLFTQEPGDIKVFPFISYECSRYIDI